MGGEVRVRADQGVSYQQAEWTLEPAAGLMLNHVGGSAGSSPGRAEHAHLTQVRVESARLPVVLQLRRRTRTGWLGWNLLNPPAGLSLLCFALIAHKVKQKL